MTDRRVGEGLDLEPRISKYTLGVAATAAVLDRDAPIP